jgi:hypothetical protein
VSDAAKNSVATASLTNEKVVQNLSSDDRNPSARPLIQGIILPIATL